MKEKLNDFLDLLVAGWIADDICYENNPDILPDDLDEKNQYESMLESKYLKLLIGEDMAKLVEEDLYNRACDEHFNETKISRKEFLEGII